MLVKKNQLLADLYALEVLAEDHRLSDGEKIRKFELVEELERTLLLEEISWRQKSREIWLREGGKNTKYFHRLANSHRRSNSISSLLINGVLFLDQLSIANAITQFYPGLYSEDIGWRPKLDNLESSSIFGEDADWLAHPFDEEEVVGVLEAFNGDKAPGLDGFPMLFFQTCWEVVRVDILAVINRFHEVGTFAKSLNATFLTLIPKKSAAVEVKDF